MIVSMFAAVKQYGLANPKKSRLERNPTETLRLAAALKSFQAIEQG